MSRFQFIADDYPEIFELCSEAEKNKKTNVDLSMLKARQALEKILSLADPDSLEDNLFDQINSLSGECSPSEMENMHTLRRLSNKAVHGETLSKKHVDEALKALLLSCCWLYFKIDEKSCPISIFLQDDRELVAPYINSSSESIDEIGNTPKNSRDINPLAFDNTFDEVENKEYNVLDKDVFETQDEYEERIQQLPPVHQGFGMIDVKQTDSYTHLAFPRFSLSKNEKIIGADIKAFAGKIEHETDEDYDGEILAALKVYQDKIYYDYSRVILKSNEKELPLIAFYWKPFEYETESEFKERIEHMPVLPVGVCKPIKQKYDMDKQILPFQVSCFNFVHDIFGNRELNISVERHQAKRICQEMGLWRIYGEVKSDINKCHIEAKTIGNGEIRNSVNKNPINKDSEEDKITNSNIDEKQSAKEQYELGEIFYNSENYDEAEKWYQKAADQGLADAKEKLKKVKKSSVAIAKATSVVIDEKQSAKEQYELGKKFYDYKNYVDAVKYYRIAADQGNMDAQYALGHCYYYGQGVVKDHGEAVKWYQKAADQGLADAKEKLKKVKKSSVAIKKVSSIAVEKASSIIVDEKQSAKEQYELGKKFYNQKNYVDAVKYYRIAAGQGIMDAQYSLGYCYEFGQGVEKDDKEAMKWYQRAANQGYKHAKEKLKAIEKSSSAIDEKYPGKDQYELGKQCYQRNNYREAVKWYWEAAEAGNADAQYELGCCYNYGQGVLNNYGEAVKWYRKAADQGNAFAQYSLGLCYTNGKGVEQDQAEAAKWYRKAADQGDEKAKEKLESLEKNSSSSSSGCFITTAVCQIFGKPDDCYELTMFRRFRDTWLNKQPDGKKLISEYYAVAPDIVKKINDSEYPDRVYQKIWELYLSPCLHYLEEGKYEECKKLYVEMVTQLTAVYNFLNK